MHERESLPGMKFPGCVVRAGQATGTSLNRLPTQERRCKLDAFEPEAPPRSQGARKHRHPTHTDVQSGRALHGEQARPTGMGSLSSQA